METYRTSMGSESGSTNMVGDDILCRANAFCREKEATKTRPALGELAEH